MNQPLSLRFHETMKHFTLTTPIRSLTSLSTHPSLSTPSTSPPHILLDYPPLATLMNSLIVAFNELRQCAPLSLGPEVAQEMRRLLESTVHDVGEYHKYVCVCVCVCVVNEALLYLCRVEHGSFTEREMETYQQLVRVLVRDFLPYVKHMFESLFSESAVEQLALMSSYPLHHSTPVGGSGTSLLSASRTGIKLGMELNVESIAEPLKTVAPDVFEELAALKRKQFVEKHQSGLSELGTDNVAAMDTEIVGTVNVPSQITEQSETSNTADDGHQDGGLVSPLTTQTQSHTYTAQNEGQLSSLVESGKDHRTSELNSALDPVKDKTT